MSDHPHNPPNGGFVEIFSPDRRQTAFWSWRRGVGYVLTWHHRITFRDFGAWYAAATRPVPDRLPVRHIDEHGFSPTVKGGAE